MNAGRELDALIAEKVMGWHLHTDKHSHTYWADIDNRFMVGISPYEDDFGYSNLGDDEDFHTLHWHPSESILWAWQVVEKLLPNFRIEYYLNDESHTDYTDAPGWHADFWLDGGTGCAEGCATAPLAICLAALKATGNQTLEP